MPEDLLQVPNTRDMLPSLSEFACEYDLLALHEMNAGDVKLVNTGDLFSLSEGTVSKIDEFAFYLGNCTRVLCALR